MSPANSVIGNFLDDLDLHTRITRCRIRLYSKFHWRRLQRLHLSPVPRLDIHSHLLSCLTSYSCATAAPSGIRWTNNSELEPRRLRKMNGEVDGSGAQVNGVHHNLQTLRQALFSSSTKARISELQTLREQIAANGKSRSSDFVRRDQGADTSIRATGGWSLYRLRPSTLHRRIL